MLALNRWSRSRTITRAWIFAGLASWGVAGLSAQSAEAATIDWVVVGSPGNAADALGVGSVAATYRISSTEVTNTQYTEFLNAVAADDPNGLYHSGMGTSIDGGIARSGAAGNFVYSAIPGMENKPVVFVPFWDTLRFANWLHNDQPVGAQGPATTENGAYTITAAGIAANSVPRNPGARAFLTNEDEWYKAAYYDEGLAIFYEYPAGTDIPTTCGVDFALPNFANCDLDIGTVTDVGSYFNTVSPSGTVDQGGNVWEWTEDISPLAANFRILRGGSNFTHNGFLSATSGWTELSSTVAFGALGFRVASIEAPACQDGIDNDGDGAVDFDGGASALGSAIALADPHCTSSWRTTEARGRRCGMGFELALGLPILMAIRLRRGAICST